MRGQVGKRSARAALCLGVFELICGILITILTIIAASKADVNTKTSPWWAGIFFALSGLLGIVAGCTRRIQTMMSYMVTNLMAFFLQGISAIWVGLQLTTYAHILLDVTKNCIKDSPNTCHCRAGGHEVRLEGFNNCEDLSTVFALVMTILVLLVAATLLALSGSILGCSVVCYRKRRDENARVVYQPSYPIEQQIQFPPPYFTSTLVTEQPAPPYIYPTSQPPMYFTQPPPYHVEDPLKKDIKQQR